MEEQRRKQGPLTKRSSSQSSGPTESESPGASGAVRDSVPPANTLGAGRLSLLTVFWRTFMSNYFYSEQIVKIVIIIIIIIIVIIIILITKLLLLFQDSLDLGSFICYFSFLCAVSKNFTIKIQVIYWNIMQMIHHYKNKHVQKTMMS